jgi:hypothetical protein
VARGRLVWSMLPTASPDAVSAYQVQAATTLMNLAHIIAVLPIYIAERSLNMYSFMS